MDKCKPESRNKQFSSAAQAFFCPPKFNFSQFKMNYWSHTSMPHFTKSYHIQKKFHLQGNTYTSCYFIIFTNSLMIANISHEQEYWAKLHAFSKPKQTFPSFLPAQWLLSTRDILSKELRKSRQVLTYEQVCSSDHELDAVQSFSLEVWELLEIHGKSHNDFVPQVWSPGTVAVCAH